MSLLLLDLDNYNNLIHLGRGKAKSQIDMRIYKRSFDAGRVKFKLNIPTNSFIYSQIYLAQNMSSVQYSCAGEVFNLTKKFYTSCSASSELKDFECDKGIQGE